MLGKLFSRLDTVPSYLPVKDICVLHPPFNLDFVEMEDTSTKDDLKSWEKSQMSNTSFLTFEGSQKKWKKTSTEDDITRRKLHTLRSD